MQETLEINEKVDSGQCTLALVGWIDSSNSYRLEQWLATNLDKGYKRITFCCRDLQFVSGAGIRVFLAAIRNVGSRDDCELVFANIGESVKGVFAVTGLSKLITQIES